MDYEKKYKEAMEKFKNFKDKYCTGGDLGFGDIIFDKSGKAQEEFDNIFPELKESKDEKMRKWLIGYFNQYKIDGMGDFANGYKVDDIIAWLEKQSEEARNIALRTEYEKGRADAIAEMQKPTDKVEPKFHEGEWIIHQGTENIYQVVACVDNQYQLKYGDNYTTQYCEDVDRCARLWDITKDAKDGDVLYSLDTNQPFIYKARNIHEQATAYCGINKYGKFFVWNTNDCIITLDKYIPATKEQRDLLFQKMKEAGYEWDAEKKELKKQKEN